MKENMFEKFIYNERACKNPSPLKMNVGQIVERKTSKSYAAQLMVAMRKAMRDHGMEFSHKWDGDVYTIRRDK